MRRRWPLILNLFIPGAGLVMLRREWLGLCIAILFTLVMQICIFGRWVVPLDVPPWITTGCSAGAAGIWALAQWLGLRREQALSGSGMDRELQRLFQCCRDAVRREEWQEAQETLQVIQRLDDERPEAAALAAEVLSGLGREKDAARWRRRAERLFPPRKSAGDLPDGSSS